MIDKNKTREAIEKASVAYSGNSYDYQEGFKAGINWFLKNLWHPMSDKPEMGSEILVLRDMEVYRKNHFGIDVNKSFVHEFDFHDNWDNYADDSEYKGWLYIENLMNDGKLNLETLEIEKPEPQFKDGDIVSVIDCYSNIQICIVKSINKNKLEYYASTSHIVEDWLNIDGKTVCLSLESEKQQLFDAIAKENKRWNAETKTLEDLPKKCELKAFDKVLVRDINCERWKVDFFSHYDETTEYDYICVGGGYKQCIPYNEQTEHLLDTTDDWEGGEV